MDPIYSTTFLKRPYVFAFFISWLVLSVRHMGVRASLRFFVLGFAIAWASEALSIRTGIPYGWYFYNYENLRNEWLLWGVPIWDSASYVFLTYAGLCVSGFLLRGLNHSRLIWAGLTALLTTLLDVIIDPVAHQGSKWFLGDIYYYPYPGWYFNVPMSNFIGWFLVTFSISGSFFLLCEQHVRKRLDNPTALKLGVAFYSAVALFNIGIAYWIKSSGLATLNLGYLFIIATLIFLKAKTHTNFSTGEMSHSN